jgi:hypothetical protein
MIVEIERRDYSTWDAYVMKTPGALPLHRAGWREVTPRTHGYETHYLMALQQSHAVGLLPLFVVCSRLVVRSATTMPGGFCANSDEVAVKLIVRLYSISRSGKRMM